ncbi:hypothetical protein [Mycolicibacterium moriokaense]|uniref:Uncharacterized protein n=1 Tax=Mycolicibacterium moriokaense TaxID=39691 RepID=A0A318HK49_9MYCO|nr:hypothetical protein [Mycolicibacterium moriokaense]PXX06338.1 hypothetical protein C8E89_114111 [Mycolicibacterium moriokaense]
MSWWIFVLDGGRMYSVLVWRNDLQRDSCDTAKRFAETAVQRIGQ